MVAITTDTAEVLTKMGKNLTDVAYNINEEDDDVKAQHLKEHVMALKRHVDQLSEKNYHDLYRNLDKNSDL